MSRTYTNGKLDLKVCWNCYNYDSFGGICLYDGVVKLILDTCSKFDINRYKEKVEELEKEIIELNDQIKILTIDKNLLIKILKNPEQYIDDVNNNVK